MIYQNTKYLVAIDSATDKDERYQVVNVEFNVVEDRVATLPQALILAKQFEMLLTNDRWEQEVTKMYADGLAAVGDYH